MVNPISQNNQLKKGLYLVPTPIGNLKDISLRSVEILKDSDYIICEDTRVSKKLLNKYEINTALISNHKFNEVSNLSKIIDLLKNNKIVSIISDAGTPCISDPGAILVNECWRQNINVIPVPGPSAVTAAVSASGFNEKYLFYGFFSKKKNELKQELERLSNINFSFVFFVSPKKINKLIPYLKYYFNDRKILICREISKYYEELIRADLAKLEEFKFEPKGELTLVISEKNIKKKSQNLSESDKRIINMIINKLSVREITDLISQISKTPKKKVYDYCLKLKNEK